MVPIIEPIDRALLRAELTPERKVRDTSRAGNEIYIFVAAECPNLMREVGRLREEAFRGAGGGTGEEVDIDADTLRAYESMTAPYGERIRESIDYDGEPHFRLSAGDRCPHISENIRRGR